MLPGGSRTASERRDARTAGLGSERRGSGQECTLGLPARPPSPLALDAGPSPPGLLGRRCAPLPHAVFQPLSGGQSLRLQEGPPQDCTAPCSSLFHSAEVAETGRRPGSPGALPVWVRRCSRGAVCAGAGGLVSSARTGGECKNRGMVPPVSALLAVGPLAAVGPWWLRRGRGGWSSTSLTPGDSDTW